MTDLRSPFPWFGGKRRVAADVWAALGDVDSYVEPFFGSGAVLLERPAWRVDGATIGTFGFLIRSHYPYRKANRAY